METSNAVSTKQPSLWSSIRGAARIATDFTTGSLNRAILPLAIPMVLEMVLESPFAVVDVFCGAAGRRRRGDGRIDGVLAEPGVCDWFGSEPSTTAMGHDASAKKTHRAQRSQAYRPLFWG
jgi:hypothetical protein